MWHAYSGELFLFLPIHLELTSPITWENGCRGKKQTTHGCSGAVFSNSSYNCISCTKSLRLYGNQTKEAASMQNGKAYLFLINFWHIVLNWMHSTHTDDSFSPPLWAEMEQRTVHIFQTILKTQMAKWDLYNGPQTPMPLENNFIGGRISVSSQISKCNN